MQGSQHSVEGSHIETKSSKTSIARQNDTSKEARRNIDGTPFILEDDDEDEEGLMMSPRFLDDFAEPSAFLGMSSQLSVARRSTNTSQSMIWQSQSQVKHTVEEHEKRLAIRHEVLSQLALWVSQVEEERGSPLPSALGGGLDFLGAADLSDGEDVDEETRRRKKKEEKPDPRGLGATLRAHFQACVQEEAKKVVDSVRKDWERERQVSVAV